MKQDKNTVIGVKLLKALIENGYRIFNTEIARKFATEVEINENYLLQSLFYLKSMGLITTIRKGIYAVDNSLLGEASVNEFEIAMALADPAAIAYWTASHYHGLTDQTPNNIYVLTTTGSKVPLNTTGKNRELIIKSIKYNVLTIKENHFFGLKKIWVGGTQVYITDLEKTLVDAMMKPKYCGGFAEVIHSFEFARDKLNPDLIIKYAKHMGKNAIRRIGWILDHLGLETTELLAKFNGYIKLNSSGLCSVDI